MRLHIAIDGPAGAGKSTIAKAVARELQIPYLDTGAMYRTLALHALSCGADPNDAAAVYEALKSFDIRVAFVEGKQRMYLGAKDVTGDIRTPQVTKGSSDIAVHPFVRDRLVELQQAFAREHDVVMDGRDIGTVVLPEAKHKFFITATPLERAKRRRLQLESKGEIPPPLDVMEREISARDHTDSTRAYNPLRQAEDAVLIDTTALTQMESIDAVLRAVR